MQRLIREITLDSIRDARYRRCPDGDWVLVAWRVLKGQWRRCDPFSARTRRLFREDRIAFRGSRRALDLEAATNAAIDIKEPER